MPDPAKTHYAAYGFHYIVGSSFAWLVDDEYSVAGRSFGLTRHNVVVALVYSESVSIERPKQPLGSTSLEPTNWRYGVCSSGAFAFHSTFSMACPYYSASPSA